MTTTGSPAPALSESGALPPGVRLTDNGKGTATIAGTPGAGTAGSYPITIRASNSVVAPATERFTLVVRPAPGYVVVSTNGAVATFDGARNVGSLVTEHVDVNDIVGVALTADAKGYWIVGRNGTVYLFGDAKLFPAGAEGKARGTVVGIAATPDNLGYWLVNSRGQVFPYGDAGPYGSLPAEHIAVGDVVSMAATADGKGYYLVTAKGAVYNFGSAVSHGDASAAKLDTPVVSITVDDATGGYWLVTSRGHVFAFDAPRLDYKSAPAEGAIVVGLAATPDGGGFFLATSEGNLYEYGDARSRVNDLGAASVRLTGVVAISSS